MTDTTTAGHHAFGMLEFSCNDVTRVAGFWARVLDLPVDDGASADYAQITPPEPRRKWLLIRRQPSGSSQSITIAITSDDLQSSTEAAVTAGATSQGLHELHGFR